MTQALLLIEFQNEWLSPQGKLHHLMEDKIILQMATTSAKKVLSVARNHNMNIIHSGLRFDEGHPELGNATSGLRKRIIHAKTFQRHSRGEQFASDFSPQAGEFIVKGRTGASAFSGSNLDLYCRHNQISTLYIMGFALQICVESTFRAADDLGYEVVVITDACAAFNKTLQDRSINDIIPHFGSTHSSQEFTQQIGKNA